MLGKKVLNNLYWHIDLSADQPEEFQARITQAEKLSSLKIFERSAVSCKR